MTTIPSAGGRRGRPRRALRAPATRALPTTAERHRSAGPDERLIRRMLAKVGARPLGHADQLADEPAPPAPVVQSELDAPSADTRRRPSASPYGRLPPPGRTIPLTAVDDEQETISGPPAAEEQVPDAPDHAADDAHEELEALLEEEEEGPASTAGPSPAEDAGGTKVRLPLPKSAPRRVMDAADDPNMRILMFNGTAAAAGYATPLVDYFAQFLPYAEQSARGVLGLLLAVAGAWLGWRATGYPAVRTVFGGMTPFVRLIGTAALAELGRRLAPIPVDWLNHKGADYGLGAGSVSLMLTALGICGGLWWFIDRRTRNLHWTGRWILRIPLASALLACALYTT
ncbi:hypothetical protein [Streptomyces sp. XH2]|uniref:hypothetical protein n=1 Tax=Streptomyces sp. XH2 TaxID=3412483 RepID=UPI003C7BCC9E